MNHDRQSDVLEKELFIHILFTTSCYSVSGGNIMKLFYGIISSVLIVVSICIIALSFGAFENATWMVGGMHMMGFGMLFTVLFWGGLIYFIWRWARPKMGRNDAEDVIKNRLARGEISQDEYVKLLQLLRGENQ